MGAVGVGVGAKKRNKQHNENSRHTVRNTWHVRSSSKNSTSGVMTLGSPDSHWPCKMTVPLEAASVALKHSPSAKFSKVYLKSSKLLLQNWLSSSGLHS